MGYLITFFFIALDFVTGFLQAVAQGTFSSKVMRQGLFHKVALVLVLLMGWLMDYAQRFVDLGVSVPVGAAVCVYIIIMEVCSALENLRKMNPELTDKLVEIFGVRPEKRAAGGEEKEK
jgi:phage-related holin